MGFCSSEILAQSTTQTLNKVRFEFLSFYQQAIDKILKIDGTEVIFLYQDFSIPHTFHPYHNSSDYQSGVVITQDRNPIAFYSRKPNKAQKWYLRESFYQLLKPVRNTTISRWVTNNL
jgi:hypothetical protein